MGFKDNNKDPLSVRLMVHNDMHLTHCMLFDVMITEVLHAHYNTVFLLQETTAGRGELCLTHSAACIETEAVIDRINYP